MEESVMPATPVSFTIAVIGLLLCAIPPSLAVETKATDAASLYRDNCAECHNEHRLGGMGPALLPGNLKRLRKKAAVGVKSGPAISSITGKVIYLTSLFLKWTTCSTCSW
jgi:mono/diheme cytochrome c family protein